MINYISLFFLLRLPLLCSVCRPQMIARQTVVFVFTKDTIHEWSILTWRIKTINFYTHRAYGLFNDLLCNYNLITMVTQLYITYVWWITLCSDEVIESIFFDIFVSDIFLRRIVPIVPIFHNDNIYYYSSTQYRSNYL